MHRNSQKHNTFIMKQKLIFLILILTTLTANTSSFASSTSANEKNKKDEKRTKFTFYGWVRNDFTFDSRQNLAVVGELFYFLPLDEKLNEYGDDLNEIPNTRLLAITSRLGVDMTTVLDSLVISAKIETDFCGASPNIVTLRIRHAYINFLWKNKHKLLVGQAWHPLSEGMLPSIVSLNTGTPFNPFSRAPQLRYDYLSKHFDFTASASYQLQYGSPGPEGSVYHYQWFGGYPELNIGLKYKYKGFQLNLQGNYMAIKPRTSALDKDSVMVKVGDISHSFSGSLYAAYTKDMFSIKARTILGQNLGHVLMMSGYGVSNMLENGTNEYSSLTQSSSWVNITYGKEYMGGIFAGYMKNLGAAKDLEPNMIYTRGFNNIDQIFRIAPSFRYTWKDLCAGIEYEYTGVDYGKTINANGTVSDTHHIGNHRIYAILIYNFRTNFK